MIFRPSNHGKLAKLFEEELPEDREVLTPMEYWLIETVPMYEKMAPSEYGINDGIGRQTPDRRQMEMSFFGAKVLHLKAIEPVLHHDILVRVKNTFGPEYSGTLQLRSRRLSRKW